MDAFYRKFAMFVNSTYWRFKLPDSSELFDGSWDNLILLDGCRWDTFEEVNSIDGTLERRISKASWTPKFLELNFENRDLSDTVYVTGNPIYTADRWYDGDITSSFYEIVDVWKDEWDESLDTVPPAAMAEATLEAYANYPNKRIISHFVQPHLPFIGEFGSQIDQAGMRGRDVALGNDPFEDDEDAGTQVWEAAKEGKIAREDLRRAYRENLELTMPHVETLVEAFDEPTVVTSDHGNYLGERLFPIPVRQFGHPGGAVSPEIRAVPWLTIHESERKTVSKGASNRERVTDDSVNEKLRDLGYM